MASRLRTVARRVVRPACDGGFSLLEIVVSIALLAIAMAAAGPQMVTSIRATSTAKVVAQAKGVLQGQLDAIRALPYRVAPAAGDHRDLLDTYFRNTAAPTTAPNCSAVKTSPPAEAWTGYVSAASSARCSFEPAGVAMYRKVIAPGSAELPPGFALVVNTTFITGQTTPVVVAPAAGYDSQVAGRDYPPSYQVGVTATVFYRGHGGWKPVTAYTQIASRTPSETRIKLNARATAVEVGTTTDTGEALTLTGGQLDLNGSLSTTSQAQASLSAIGSSGSVAGRAAGASLSAEAPYTNLVNLNATAGSLLSGCDGPCWGATLIPPFVLAADNGLPRAGVDGLAGVLNPVQTQLPDNVTRDGFRFRVDDPTLSGLSDTLVSLDAVPPVGSVLTNLVNGLYNCAFSITGALSHLTGSGYLNSTDELAATNPMSVEACGGAHTNVIRLLPTSLAPDGLIRITARSAARCRVTGLGHTPEATVSYRAEVEYWRWVPGIEILGIEIGGYGQYVSAGVITPSTTTDPLAAVPLTTLVSSTRTLGDYVESVSGLTADRVTRSATGRVAEASIPAMVTVLTKPVFTGDPATAVSLSVGAASCRAEDNR
ncbi:MAG: prepilin-type N-terminal cleavage/methylation domain-containing protein [Sporichthyaceae bacterium]